MAGAASELDQLSRDIARTEGALAHPELLPGDQVSALRSDLRDLRTEYETKAKAYNDQRPRVEKGCQGLPESYAIPKWNSNL
jgi:hypothetical protein